MVLPLRTHMDPDRSHRLPVQVEIDDVLVFSPVSAVMCWDVLLVVAGVLPRFFLAVGAVEVALQQLVLVLSECHDMRRTESVFLRHHQLFETTCRSDCR